MGAALFTPLVSAKTVHVFVLMGQSNMGGEGKVSGATTNGTLEWLLSDTGRSYFDNLPVCKTMAGGPKTACKAEGATLEGLQNEDGSWANIPDVWVESYGTRYDPAPCPVNGPLTVGYGGHLDTIGPELGMGKVLREEWLPDGDEILLIKAVYGGTALGQDWLPPSSGWVGAEEFHHIDIAGTPGWCYRNTTQHVLDVVEPKIAELVPGSVDKVKIAGLAWFQGWDDGDDWCIDCDINYTTNVVNLMQDLRRDLGAPRAPFVLAVSGFGGWNETYFDAWSKEERIRRNNVVAGQIQVPKTAKGRGKVACVETRGFWRETGTPRYDFNGNAESYFNIGVAMGRAMMLTLKDKWNQPELYTPLRV